MEPGISSYSNGFACLPNLPKTSALSPPTPSCSTTYASPYLDSLSGSLRRFWPQGFFFIVPCWAQYCPMCRTAFELGEAEFPPSAKTKTEKGLCYVGTGGRQLGGISFCFNLVLISWYLLVFIGFFFILFDGLCKTPLRCLISPWSRPWRL